MYYPMFIPIHGEPMEFTVPTIIVNFGKISLAMCLTGLLLLLFEMFSNVALEKEHDKLFRFAFGLTLTGVMLLMMAAILLIFTGEKV